MLGRAASRSCSLARSLPPKFPVLDTLSVRHTQCYTESAWVSFWNAHFWRFTSTSFDSFLCIFKDVKIDFIGRHSQDPCENGCNPNW